MRESVGPRVSRFRSFRRLAVRLGRGSGVSIGLIEQRPSFFAASFSSSGPLDLDRLIESLDDPSVLSSTVAVAGA